MTFVSAKDFGHKEQLNYCFELFLGIYGDTYAKYH